MKPAANANPLISAHVLINSGKYDEAEDILRGYLKQFPADATACYLAGSVHFFRKNYEESVKFVDKALSGQPDYCEALNMRGLIYFDFERNIPAAEACFKKTLAINPRYANALTNLGSIAFSQNKFDEALAYHRQALEIDPNNMPALNNVAATLSMRGQFEDVLEYYERALEQQPQDTELIANLLSFLMIAKKPDKAAALVSRVLVMKNPGLAAFVAFNFCNLHALWREASQLLASVLQQIAKGKATLQAFENINLSLLAIPELSNEVLFETHKSTGKIIERMRLHPPYTEHPNAFASCTKVRIGYLSPDFRAHSVNNFLRGIVNAHDRDRFEIFCYSSTSREDADATTEQYRAIADAFIDINDMSDAEAAERILKDGIHILVDLAGYTFRSRITILSYRPAPVQISYIGYPYTSGIREIDYFVSNAYLDGPRNHLFFTEKQLHLPESPFTFDSLTIQPVDPEPPFARNGYITFGTLNNVYKYSPRLIGVWSQILKSVPDSRFVINHPTCAYGPTRENILHAFTGQGVAAERIRFLWQKHPLVSHLPYYNDIDISLDTFPLTGGTTTIDAIWMGVPVITLVGDLYYQRLSYSFLMNTGIDVSDMCAFSEAEYVQKAVAMAGRPERIRELRRFFPESLKTSVLRDSLRLTRQLEAAYIEGWSRKFPNRPFRFGEEADDADVEFVPLPSNVQAAVKHSPADQDSYVLKEHHGWYDTEYRFVLDAIGAGARILDINAGLGAYALPLAQTAGAGGRVWATTRFPHEARLLALSRRHNGLENFEVIVKGDRKLHLDRDSVEFGFEDLDFVRIDPAHSNTMLLECAEAFFTEHSPWVMFGSWRVNSYAKQGPVESFFQAKGYAIYRYVPGLDLLVPVESGGELDSMAINVFACKDDRAARLAERGMLVRETIPLPAMPGIGDMAWLEYLSRYPYAKDLAQGWESASVDDCGDEWGDVYRVSLNLFTAANDPSVASAERYAAMQAACSTLLSLAQVAPTFPRSLSLARVFADLGRREDAVKLLAQLIGMLESGASFDLNEPFLPLTARYANLDPGGHTAEWLLASLLEQFETLRAFSSWFSGEESRAYLELLCATGFQSGEMERRLHLLNERFRTNGSQEPLQF